jgi:hypothetical protein
MAREGKMKYNRHFVISAESTKKNFDPTEEEAINRAKLSVDFAKEKKLENIGEIYAKSVFSSDGFVFSTGEKSALDNAETDSKNNPAKIHTIPELDKFIRSQIKGIPVDSVLSGMNSAHAVYEILTSSPEFGTADSVDLDKKTFDEYGITLDSVVDIIDSFVRLGHRMQIDSTISGGHKKWSSAKGHHFFDENFAQVGVTWLDSDSLAVAIAGSVNSRLWVVELEVASA